MSDRSMGPVLRHLGGDATIEVLLRTEDFNIQEVQDQSGQKVSYPCRTLIAFQAVGFRELEEGADIWEFRTTVPSQAGAATAYMYAHGTDILTVRCMGKVL